VSYRHPWDGLRVWARLCETTEADAWLVDVDYGRLGSSAPTVTDRVDGRQGHTGGTESGMRLK
jgi:hypothetical protein